MIKLLPTPGTEWPPVRMEIVTDPVEIAEARIQWARAKLNYAWFDAHAAELYELHRGKCLCVAGQELFVADTMTEAEALAKSAHPEDNGRIHHYIPKDRAYRIYHAN